MLTNIARTIVGLTCRRYAEPQQIRSVYTAINRLQQRQIPLPATSAVTSCKHLQRWCPNHNNHRNLSYNSNSGNIPIALYDEIKDLPAHPEKLLIDVREPSELAETGSIPTSINIPLDSIALELSPCVESSDFKNKYGREKPTKSTQIIFTCKMGRRAANAAEIAIALDYTNVKNYKGSWTDWAAHEGQKK